MAAAVDAPHQHLYLSGVLIHSLKLPGAELKLEFDTEESHFYAPGDSVSGSISLTLSSPLEVKSMELTVHAEATLTVGTSTQRQIFFQDKHRMLSKPPGEGMLELEAKTHKANFKMDLPKEGPPTVMSREDSGQYVFAIRYFATAVIYQSGFATELQTRVLKPVVATSRQLLVQHNVPEQQLAAAAAPVQYSISANLKQKKLSAKLELAREIYLMGEYVQGVLTFDEKSKVPKQLIFSIEQQMTFPTSGSVIKDILATVSLAPDKKHARSGLALTLPIPQSAVPSQFGCSVQLVSVAYYLRVQMRFSRAGEPVTMYPLYVLPARDLEGLQLHLHATAASVTPSVSNVWA